MKNKIDKKAVFDWSFISLGVALLLYIATMFFTIGCCPLRQVEIEHRVEYTYKDSTILKDSTVVIPVERIVDVVPVYDSLKMETSMAKASAWVDTTTHTLKGNLENKQGIQYKYIYKDRIEYRDSLVYKEVPVEVEVVKTVHPKYEVWLWWWLALSVAGIALFIYKKILPF